MHTPMMNVVRNMMQSLATKNRRGTVLLLVIGTLAMVLILSVVYAAIGKGDRRTARAVVSRTQTSESVDEIAEYILDVFATDVFNVVPEVTDNNALGILGVNSPIVRREAVDLPYTDPYFVSVPGELAGVGDNQSSIDAVRFRPDGGHRADVIWDLAPRSGSSLQDILGSAFDTRVASDPFLASTRPSFLGEGSLTGGASWLDRPAYERNQSWLQISDFAPDGRFVNMFYLRPGANGTGFGASSLDLTRDPGSNNSRLSLFSSTGTTTTSDLPFDQVLGMTSSPEADWNRPWHWNMYQANMFRPVNDYRFETSTLGDPSSEDYWAYQYADADGDGIIDSRWSELVDATDPTRITSILSDSDYRFFVAVRAIDLSSLVNVSTASDFLAPSTTTNRVGSGPHEISIFKLLHGTEHALEIASQSEADSNNGVWYSDAFATGSGGLGDYGQYDGNYTKQLGRKGHLRLAETTKRGTGLEYSLVPGEQDGNAILSDDLRNYTAHGTAEDRRNFSASIGTMYPGINAGGNQRSAPYSISDLIELLTFHGVNDSDNFSLLEQTLAADNSGDTFSSFSPLRSDRATILDAWPADGVSGDLQRLEMKRMQSAVDIRRMLTTVSGNRPLRSSILDQADIAELTMDNDRKIWLDGSVLRDRNYINDIAGDESFAASYEGPKDDRSFMDAADRLEAFQEEEAELIANAFALYLEVLAPNLNASDWDTSSANVNYDSTKTQYYGHMGPELAVRLAGHMALNFRDMADMPVVDLDQNGIPDYASVLNMDLSNPATKTAYATRTDNPTPAVLRLTDAWTHTPGGTDILDQLWEAGYKLDIEAINNPSGAAGIPSGLADQASFVSHSAMIQYGIEPQPFLSEAASLTMYTDVERVPGDNFGFGDLTTAEYIEFPGGGADGLVGNDDDYSGLPSIDGTVDVTNPDFIFQTMFFKMFNPFDVPIVLDRYYIEYAGSFYMLADGTTPLVIEPRETVVFWAANPGGTAELDARIEAAIPGSTGGILPSTAASSFEAMIQSQLGLSVTLQKIGKRYANPPGNIGQPVVIPDGTVLDLFHQDPAAKNTANRVVMLWRDNPNYADTATGLLNPAATTFQYANRTTDQLVDRLRDTSNSRVSSAVVGSSVIERSVLDRRLDLPDDLELEPLNLAGITVQNALTGDAANYAGNPAIVFGSAKNYNNGQITVALWGSIGRSEDSSLQSGRSAINYATNVTAGSAGDRLVDGAPVGALPAAIFESAGIDPFTRVGSKLWNVDSVAGNGNRLWPEELNLMTDILGNPYPEANEDALLYWNSLADGTLGLEAFVSLGKSVMDGAAGITLVSPIGTSEVDDFADYEGDSFIQITVDQNEFRDILSGRRSLRVGDMMLPLAVGGYRTPLEPSASGAPATPDGVYSTNVTERLAQYEAQWTTLGEALAAAAGYADTVGPVAGQETSGPDDPFTELSFIDNSPGASIARQDSYVLDRGHLRLDAFVPFIDMDADGLFTVGDDIRRGLGIPMALEMFNIAQAGSDLGQVATGSLIRPVMGTVNVNTAEPEILRLIPGLGVDVHSATPGAGLDKFLSWSHSLQLAGATPATSPSYFMNHHTSANARSEAVVDVGGTIAAYREATRFSRLYIPRNPIPGAPSTTASEILVDRLPIDTGMPELGIMINREASSGMPSLRSTPGILSLGELLAARDVRAANTTTQHDMDGFARDERTAGAAFIRNLASGYEGVVHPQLPSDMATTEIVSFGEHMAGDLLGMGLAKNPALSDTDIGTDFPGAAGSSLLPIMPDQIPDDYDEQLVQLNAALNSMSVGSDYYAVWFVVHGYKESDTLDLGASDPLVPSFSGRYLMIVDRSNVTVKGQRPKVLAFVQLPESLPLPGSTGGF